MKLHKMFLNFLQKTSLPTQLTIILFVLYSFGSIVFLILLNTYYTYYYNRIIRVELNTIKNILTPALVPLLLTEDYDKIEKYLSLVVKDSHIDSVELINPNGRTLLSIASEKENIKVTYLPQGGPKDLEEGLVEDKDSILETFSLKTNEKPLAWIIIKYSKRELHSLYKESFLIIFGLLLAGALGSALALRFFFGFINRDLKEVINYLLTLPTAKGIPFHGVCHSKEITNLKSLAEELSFLLSQQEREILREKYKLEEILSALSEGVVFTDYELKILYYNRAFLDLVAISTLEDLEGKPLGKILTLQDKDRKRDLWETLYPLIKLAKENLLSQGLTFEEAYFPLREGAYKILEISLNPLKNEYLQGFLFILRDITQRKLMEKEIERIQKFEALDKLAGGVAHDLRNLLAGLYNYINILKLKFPLQENSSKELLAKIDKLLERASVLSFQLLSLSKGGVPVKEASNIVEVLKDTADFCFSGFPVEAEMKIHTPLGKLLLDPHQIAQVFQNIFINAREAMPGGGKVVIEVNLRDLSEEEVPPLSPGKYLSISISDTGHGIAPEILPHIFDPFFTTKEGGTGLGLSVAFQIIRHHGGYITVSSEPGKGTTFTIYLPYEEAEEIVEEPKVTLEKTKETEKILVIDDEKDIRDTLKFILSEFGYRVEIAGSGKEALEIFKQENEKGEPFKIVITDFIMPDITGEKLLLHLKEIYPYFKAILSTGYAEIPAVSDYKKFGFDKILLKPYTIEKLLQILKEQTSLTPHTKQKTMS